MRLVIGIGIAWIQLLTIGSNASGQTPEFRLVLDRIVPLDPTRVFDVTDVLIGKDGAIYVRQEETANISAFTASGEFVRTIGLRGTAPGRFLGAGLLGWVGDTLWSTDYTTRRIEYYHPTGRHFRSHVAWVPLDGPFLPQLLGPTLADGSVLAVPTTIPEKFSRMAPADSLPLLRLRRGSLPGNADTIAILSIRHTYGMAKRQTPQGVRQFEFQQPLSDDPIVAIARNGEAFVIVDRRVSAGTKGFFRVTKFSSQARKQFGVRLAYSPIAITPSLLNTLIPDSVRLRAILEQGALFVPTHQPPISAAFVARDGKVWIRGPLETDSTTKWIVLDENGRMEKNVRADSRLQLLEADGAIVWVVQNARSRKPVISRYRLIEN